MSAHLARRASPPGAPTYAEMLDQIELLNEQIRQLQQLLAPTDCVPIGFGLTKSEAAILMCVYARSPNRISTDHLTQALYFNDQDGGGSNATLKVFIYKIRKKMEPHGVKIETAWGQGYRMSAESAAILRAMITPTQQGM